MKVLYTCLLSLIVPIAASQAEEPSTLDLSDYYHVEFDTPTSTNWSFAEIMGPQVFDGLPFNVDGRVVLFGSRESVANPNVKGGYPDVIGVKVGRTFDELHLLHAAKWPDVQGATIAVIRLQYEDGSHHDFPIGYGVHVRDWQRLPSEKAERMADEETKVVWRGKGFKKLNSTQRLFKSKLVNPNPGKVVKSLDVVSTRNIAAYDLIAATVADERAAVVESPPIPEPSPAFVFDGHIQVLVEDHEGFPMKDVWVSPGMFFPDSGVYTVGEPLYTDVDGHGVALYPQRDSSYVGFHARKPGWIAENRGIRFSEEDGKRTGYEIVIRMRPDPSVPDVGADAATDSSTSDSIDVAQVTHDSKNRSSDVRQKGDDGHAREESLESTSGDSALEAIDSSALVLFIGLPAGSRVRIETAESLTAGNWEPVTTIEKLPFSPYPFVCEHEDCDAPSAFYRAVPDE